MLLDNIVSPPGDRRQDAARELMARYSDEDQTIAWRFAEVDAIRSGEDHPDGVVAVSWLIDNAAPVYAHGER